MFRPRNMSHTSRPEATPPSSGLVLKPQQDAVHQAFQILARVKDQPFADRQDYLHPFTFLSALLTHAPTLSGKAEIANDIVTSDNANLVSSLARLTDYFWTSLLIPR